MLIVVADAHYGYLSILDAINELLDTSSIRTCHTINFIHDDDKFRMHYIYIQTIYALHFILNSNWLPIKWPITPLTDDLFR